MEKDIKVSVIIPVYNAEKILEKGLFLLTKQTLREIEFICVNDASTDGSLNVLKAFKEVFPEKFVVIDSEKNRGPGGARNIGLKYAKGEYIGFVDQDDYCHEEMYAAMYEEAKSGDYDIVKCSFYNREKDEISRVNDIKGELDTAMRRYLYIQDSCYVWNKVFKRKLIDSMSMHFRENVADDDTDFYIEAGLRAKRVSAIEKAYYYYNYEGETLSRKRYIDIEHNFIYTGKLLDSIVKRTAYSPNRETGDMICEQKKTFHIGRLMYGLFFKPDLCFEDLEKFDKFAVKYLPEYYNIKDKESNLLEVRVFNELDKDVHKSWENISRLRRYAAEGKLGEQVQNALKGTAQRFGG